MLSASGGFPLPLEPQTPIIGSRFHTCHVTPTLSDILDLPVVAVTHESQLLVVTKQLGDHVSQSVGLGIVPHLVN